MTEKKEKKETVVRAKKIVSINLVQSNKTERRLGEYLRLQRDVAGLEIKDLIMDAIVSYYDPLAISADPNSSPAEIESALIESVLSLAHQRNRLISIIESYGVNLRSGCKSIIGLGDLQSDRESTVPRPLLQKQTPPTVDVDIDVEDEKDEFSTNDFKFGD